MSTLFFKKYRPLIKIGEGSFSEVLKCQNRETYELVAAKRIYKTFKSAKAANLYSEVLAMRQICPHPNVLQIIETIFDPKPGNLTIVFELMDFSLYDLIKRRTIGVSEIRARRYLIHILSALEHIHRNGFFHRDVKPENILLRRVYGTHGHDEDEVLKIADLGSTKNASSKHPFTEYISTRWYRSPECLLTAGCYSSKMDIWATGCVFYEMLTLNPLFPGINEIDQLDRIHKILGTPHPRLLQKLKEHKSSNYYFTFTPQDGTNLRFLLPNLSEAGREVLKMMLIYDPDMRTNIKRLIRHKYFSRNFDYPSRDSRSLAIPPSISSSKDLYAKGYKKRVLKSISYTDKGVNCIHIVPRPVSKVSQDIMSEPWNKKMDQQIPKPRKKRSSKTLKQISIASEPNSTVKNYKRPRIIVQDCNMQSDHGDFTDGSKIKPKLRRLSSLSNDFFDEKKSRSSYTKKNTKYKNVEAFDNVALKLKSHKTFSKIWEELKISTPELLRREV